MMRAFVTDSAETEVIAAVSQIRDLKSPTHLHSGIEDAEPQPEELPRRVSLRL